MALGGALVAAWIATAAPVAAAPAATPDFARFQSQVETQLLALSAETPVAQTPAIRQSMLDKAASSVRARLQAAEALLRRVGLDPQRFTKATGVGGPLLPVSTAAADSRFRTLSASWEQLAAMEAAIAAIPSYVPVKAFTFTSAYGVRSDPFSGGSAMHAGLDMAGKSGEPIYAAADGIVVTGGRSGAYGNLVELDHGKGLATRYGHLSAVLVQPGSRIRQGQLIGRMGSTGRSTGTHLHYEIRLDGRAINPRPFLESSAFMLAAQNGGTRSYEGPSLAATLSEDESVTFSISDRVAEPLIRN